MKIALVSAFLEDEVYGKLLDDNFMENVICKEDHFYHRIALSLTKNNFSPTVYYMSKIGKRKEFTHRYGHKIIRIPARKIAFFHESIVFSRKIIDEILNNQVCFIVSGYYVKYKIPDMFDYILHKIHGKMPIIARWAGGKHEWLFPGRKNIKKNALRRCNSIICSSSLEINNLEKIFGVEKENIKLMYNPIDTNQFRPRGIDEVKDKINFSTEKKYLLYVGRLIERHGIELVLDVFKKLVEIRKDLILILIGDGPMLNQINKFLSKNNLNDFVEIKGRLDHKTISFYYNICSILFHVGPSGGVPNVIMEAIASGLPVIANYDSSGNRQLVNEESGTGILIKNKNELESAISKILDNELRINEKSRDVITDFSIENYGKKIKLIIDDIFSKTNFS